MRNFDDRNFRNKARGFEQPIQLPHDPDTARQWQEANKSWWEITPMRYDWRTSIGIEPGTKPYFDEIDARFLDSVTRYMPWKVSPFESLIPYKSLHELDVLEIGVGQGLHAQLMAPHAKSFTGIDLTEAASGSTQKRFDLAGIKGRILCMDAEAMAFPSNSFDFIWSWGVIHHSSDTKAVLREMHRVLRNGGRATVMVYYRSFMQYYVINGIGRRLFRGGAWNAGGLHQANQAATDGAIARYFSIDDFSKLVGSQFLIERALVTGQKADAIPLPNCRLKTLLIKYVPDFITRFLTDRLRFGTFLIVDLKKS